MDEEGWAQRLCRLTFVEMPQPQHLLDEDITGKTIGAMFAVHNKLGFGFLESVYLGAMTIECRRRGLRVDREVPIEVRYEGAVIGFYRIDLLVEGRIIVEVKACAPHDDHHAQVINYLRSSDKEVGLLLYFRRSATFKRFIFRNSLKRH